MAMIKGVVDDFVKFSKKTIGACVLQTQLKLYEGKFPGTSYADATSL